MKKMSWLLAAFALGLPAIGAAGPSDYVYVPSVEYGEREIDFKAGSRKLRDDRRESAYSIGFGWGATSWWFTELYAIWHKPPDEKHGFDAWEWENKFQLTETGKYPLDVGFLLEIEIPKAHREEGYEIKVGPLFQFDTGAIRWNANLLFERVLRGRAEGPRVTEMGYQLQARYDLDARFAVGTQALGEVGAWDHWAPREEQSHRVGPAIFGKVKLGGREAIRYNAAWLRGVGDGSPRNTVRMQAEYEF